MLQNRYASAILKSKWQGRHAYKNILVYPPIQDIDRDLLDAWDIDNNFKTIATNEVSTDKSAAYPPLKQRNIVIDLIKET